jgi:two-component system KDP operon response regulator KdpE
MRRTLRASLTAQGFAIREAKNGEEAIREIAENPVDLVLLDIEMSGIGGMETCRRLRPIAPRTGIIMLTVRDAEDEMVRALEAGADDYIIKPFRLRELLARLRAVLRRVKGSQTGAAVLRVGDLELDIERRSLHRAGLEIHLSPTEFSILSYMMQHANLPVEHGELLRVIWGPEYGGELEYLRTYIKRLRQKIEANASQPEYLLTVPWLGYRFHDPSRMATPPANSVSGILAG